MLDAATIGTLRRLARGARVNAIRDVGASWWISRALWSQRPDLDTCDVKIRGRVYRIGCKPGDGDYPRAFYIAVRRLAITRAAIAMGFNDPNDILRWGAS